MLRLKLYSYYIFCVRLLLHSVDVGPFVRLFIVGAISFENINYEQASQKNKIFFDSLHTYVYTVHIL